MRPTRVFSSACLVILGVASFATAGCFTVVQVRIQNASMIDFHDVELGDTPYGRVPAGKTTEFKPVRLVPLLRYADLRLTGSGRRITGQTLIHRGRCFTHRVEVIDLTAGHLAIEVLQVRPDMQGGCRDQ